MIIKGSELIILANYKMPGILAQEKEPFLDGKIKNVIIISVKGIRF